MRFHHSSADVFVPDGSAVEAALARTTHLAIAAHQDDIEIMAYHGIAECFGRQDRWFTGVVATDGAGSPRAGVYAGYSDEQMQQVRRGEQRNAAALGQYSCQIQLGFTSAQVKAPGDTAVIDDLAEILRAASPETVYLHNPADKHETHVALALRSIAALRGVASEVRPRKVYGCEVWRDLDWLPDGDKQALPVSARPHLAAALLGVFDSQIAGGKRYDLATAGRRLAHATYHESHATDQAAALTFAMDLTPLIHDPNLDVVEYVRSLIERFRSDVEQRLKSCGAGQ